MTSSFIDTLNSQFDNIELTIPSYTQNLYHLYADFTELVCLFNSNDWITKADMSDRFRDNGHLLVEEEEIEGLENTSEIGSIMPQVDDIEEDKWNIIFEVIRNRQTDLKNEYPFSIQNSSIKLKNELSERNKLYLCLLTSSSLSYFKSVQHHLTSEFETISCYALKDYLSPYSIVREFGKNSAYTGSTKEKIEKLSKELNVEINRRELNNISTRSNQDGGLDLVAWTPCKDKNPNMLIIFGQCACGKEWFKKQHETKTFKEYFKFYKLDPIDFLFIPYALNDSNGRFYQSNRFTDCLIFDRTRIIKNLNDTSFFNSLNSRLFVDKCIEYQEGLT